MPDQTARHDGLGVAVARVDIIISGGHLYSENLDPESRTFEPGRWFLEAEAAALLDVAEATLQMRDTDGWINRTRAVRDALDRLEAARKS